MATLQSLVLLALAGLVGVPYSPMMMLALVGLMFLMAFIDPATRATLDPGISWHHWQVPVGVQVALVVAVCGVLLAAAVVRFARTE